jgi:hypothetical protein
MPEQATPQGYGRRPDDGPCVSRAEINRRQAERLNETDNGVITDGKVKPFVPPERSDK